MKAWHAALIVELCLSLLTGHLLQRLDACILADVFAKQGDVYVFGETLDQAEALRQ